MSGVFKIIGQANTVLQPTRSVSRATEHDRYYNVYPISFFITSPSL